MIKFRKGFFVMISEELVITVFGALAKVQRICQDAIMGGEKCTVLAMRM